MTSETDQFISYDVQEGIGFLILNRPPVNVLNIDTLQQMEAALAALAQASTLRVLVVGAKGKMFSAGVDVADHTAEKVNEMIPLFDRVCRALAEFPVPTIAAVHGHALGGGCEVVLCCDLAMMAGSAKIGQPEIQLATIAPIAALRLPALVGYRAAADILFSGRTLAAAEAARLGLVNDVVSAEELDNRVREKAAQLAALSRPALRLAKRALRLGTGGWDDALPEVERLYLQELMNTADAHEGVAAFMEKRAPVWQHH